MSVMGFQDIHCSQKSFWITEHVAIYFPAYFKCLWNSWEKFQSKKDCKFISRNSLLIGDSFLGYVLCSKVYFYCMTEYIFRYLCGCEVEPSPCSAFFVINNGNSVVRWKSEILYGWHGLLSAAWSGRGQCHVYLSKVVLRKERSQFIRLGRQV